MANSCFICCGCALYTEENLQIIVSFTWVSRVTGTLTAAKELLEKNSIDVFVPSKIPGYRIAPCCNDSGGVGQPSLVIESEARKESDLKQLEKQTSDQKIYLGTIPTTKIVSTGICMWRRCIQRSQIT